jgi:hypothetical protein
MHHRQSTYRRASGRFTGITEITARNFRKADNTTHNPSMSAKSGWQQLKTYAAIQLMKKTERFR